MDKLLKSMRSAFQMTKRRCYSPTCADYRYYGGRGVTICDRWLDSFDNFVADMGLRPEGMTLERVDNNKGYEPGNCIWASRKQQANNRRVNVTITYQGRTQPLSDWAVETGIPYNTLKARVNRLGYSPEEALTKPVRCGEKLPTRAYKPRRKPDMSRVPRGMSHPFTALSRDQVLTMRAKHADGASFSALAREAGVSIETASKAVQGHGAYGEIK